MESENGHGDRRRVGPGSVSGAAGALIWAVRELWSIEVPAHVAVWAVGAATTFIAWAGIQPPRRSKRAQEKQGEQ